MEYKINKESVKKYGGYVPLTEVDALDGATKRLEDFIWEAWREALKEGIRANTVLINKHFAKVNEFPFAFMDRSGSLPPMICGLEVHISNELPDGYDFAVLETPETEREKLIRQTRADTVKKMQEKLKKRLYDNPCLFTQQRYIVDADIDQIAKEILEGTQND